MTVLITREERKRLEILKNALRGEAGIFDMIYDSKEQLVKAFACSRRGPSVVRMVRGAGYSLKEIV